MVQGNSIGGGASVLAILRATLRSRETWRVSSRYLLMVVSTLVTFSVLAAAVPTFLGMDSFIIDGGSMRPAIPAGALVVSKRVDPSVVVPGDIITFRHATSPGSPVTHRVVKVLREGDGTTNLLTKGDANSSADPEPVATELPVSRMVYSLPYAGYVLEFSRTSTGKAALIVAPALLLLLSIGRKSQSHEASDAATEVPAPTKVVDMVSANSATPLPAAALERLAKRPPVTIERPGLMSRLVSAFKDDAEPAAQSEMMQPQMMQAAQMQTEPMMNQQPMQPAPHQMPQQMTQQMPPVQPLPLRPGAAVRINAAAAQRAQAAAMHAQPAPQAFAPQYDAQAYVQPQYAQPQYAQPQYPQPMQYAQPQYAPQQYAQPAAQYAQPIAPATVPAVAPLPQSMPQQQAPAMPFEDPLELEGDSSLLHLTRLRLRSVARLGDIMETFDRVEHEAAPLLNLVTDLNVVRRRFAENLDEAMRPLAEFADRWDENLLALAERMDGELPTQIDINAERRRIAEIRAQIPERHARLLDQFEVEKQAIDAALTVFDEQVARLETQLTAARRTAEIIGDSMRTADFARTVEFLRRRTETLGLLAERGAATPEDIADALPTASLLASDDEEMLANSPYLASVISVLEDVGQPAAKSGWGAA
jgi:signal peptidase